jgi:hypothetical protein
MALHWLLPSLLTALALAGSTGCSKSGCDPSQCAAGNQCIDDRTGGGAICRKVCAAQADCPANWYCNDGLKAGGVSWCVQNTLTFDAGAGQWGVPCQPNHGEGANPGCDWAQGFACYAQSPTDGNAFCTQFACSGDGDCPGGWWCSTQNVGPNATSSVQTIGKTRSICLPRGYCAPCKKDLDCYSAPGSQPQHCVPDSKGAGFCSTTCAGDSNCDFDSTCKAPWAVCTPAAGQPCQSDDDCPPAKGTFQHCVAPQANKAPDAGGSCTPECGGAADCNAGQTCMPTFQVCLPRAGVCVGDGTFCSPCRSDLDCTPATTGAGAGQGSGVCFSSAPYSQERFCGGPSTVNDCDASASDPPGCPTPSGSDNWKHVGCTQTPGAGVQCFGIVTFGTASGNPVGIPGCWTVNR